MREYFWWIACLVAVALVSAGNGMISCETIRTNKQQSATILELVEELGECRQETLQHDTCYDRGYDVGEAFGREAICPGLHDNIMEIVELHMGHFPCPCEESE